MTHTLTISSEHAPIFSATLYNNSVEVCRKIKHQLSDEDFAKGPVIDYKIELKNQSVDHESVRVQDATGKATILEVATGTDNTTSTSIIAEYPKAKELYDLLVTTLRKKGRLESEVAEAEECKNALKAMRVNVVHARAGPLSGLPNLESTTSSDLVKNIAALSSQVTEEISSIDSSCLDWEIEIRKLRDEGIRLKGEIVRICGSDFHIDCSAVEGLKNAAEQLTICRLRTTQHVIVKCNAEQPGPIEFTLVYTLAKGRWSPAYDLKASTTDLSSAELTYYGVVNQSTTEDWNDISLILSTGSPSLAGHPKHLPPLNVGYPPEPAPQVCGAYAAPRALMRRAKGARPEMMCLMSMSNMTADCDTTSHATFSLPGHYSVPSDGEAHKLAIMQKRLDTTICYYAFPEADQTVYRAAMFKNTSDYYLLPSEAVSIFWDNSFVAKTKLPAVPPGAEFQTYLGREMQVQVEIQPLRKYRKTAGSMFTGGTTDKEGYEHAGWIQNLRKHPIVLMTAFRLPRSSDETIKIQMDTAQGKHVTVSCRTDLEVFSHPDVPKLDARNPTVIVVNEPTDHCIIMNYLEPAQKSKVVCSYFIERPINKPIEIV